MNYLVSDKNTLIWFCFTLYAVTAVFLLPNIIEFKSSTIDVSEQKVWQFTSRFILRIALVLPMVFLLKNAI
ncbi:MAG: hypothetical protein HC939_15890 [Pleurocapsa sp. SU_5_0]|uniref:hypothetical protein n=1 Tax=Pleurocapsa sp. CCALA 161 TaxID=2107688 RepID=UPI000D07768E|nr:hypothetical protein [Pleurocapsa sp. CCALA 161]NJK57375.1 hypothetical protein [Pleurocapsa sp. SU_5_0]NJR46847.1 hypothetical protein [Hyellaceae cyanobacterium CSU_1_1]PSB12494.1 hypothetical protein C7B62_01350 [Pleurocapsa sp. CCALA 161]